MKLTKNINNLKRSTSSIGISTAVFQASNIIAIAIASNLTEKTDFGRFILIYGIITNIGLILGSSLGNIIIRTINSSETSYEISKKNKSCENFLLISFAFLFTLSVIYAGELSEIIFSNRDEKLTIIAGAFFIYLFAKENYIKNCLIGLNENGKFLKIHLIIAIIPAPIYYIICTTLKNNGPIYSLFLITALTFLITRLLTKEEINKINVAENKNDSSKALKNKKNTILQETIPATVAAMAVVPAHLAVQLLISQQIDGYISVAILGITMQWFNIILFIPGVASRALLPVLSKKTEKNKKENLLKTSLKLNAASTLILFLIIIIFGNFILKIYNQNSENAIYVLYTICGSAVIASLSMPIGQYLISLGKFWLCAIINLIWLSIYIGLIFFTESKTAETVSTALLVAYSIHTILLFSIYKIIKNENRNNFSWS